MDVALATEACRRMGYEPVFRQISWDEKDLLLEIGQVDCLWGCFSMNGRENAYLWAGPYLYSDQVVAVRADSDICTLADLADRRVAVQISSKAESILSDPADARIPQLRALYCLVDMDQVATALRKYYVDACASHAEALAGALEKAGVSYRFLDEPLLHAQLGVAFAAGGDTALRDLLARHGVGPIVAHAPYTLNLCGAEEKNRIFARETMADDLARLEHVPGQYYNFHPGSHVGQGSETGIALIAD